MTFPYRIKFIKARDFSLGRTEPIRAIVNHRMVGYLAGTDSYFKAPDRPVSTHFGIGIINGVVEVHQYVPLDDTAFGNGNYDASGNWDNWGYKTTEINPQTISIEHQDHGDPKGKGVVSESIQQASIALQALLLRGTIAQWKTAGIVVRDWTNNGPILQKELHAIVPGPRTIINHNDIAGKLKPYCWKPWSADTIGFPSAKYIAGIKAILTPPAPAPTPDTTAPVTYTQAQLDTIVKSAVDGAITAANAQIAILKGQIDAQAAENKEVAATLTAAAARLTT